MCLQNGFPFAGHLPQCKVAIRPGMPRPLGRLSVSDLRKQKKDFNQLVLGNLKSSQFSDDVVSETNKDVEAGAMLGPWPLGDVDLDSILLSRRMPVREERQAGWKTRIVDDCSESGVNMATQAQEKLKNDGIDILALMARSMARTGRQPLLWKRDIESAFRKLPIEVDHHDLTYVVFMVHGEAFVAQHIAMPFGTTSAVHAWHRTGTWLSTVLRIFSACRLASLSMTSLVSLLKEYNLVAVSAWMR